MPKKGLEPPHPCEYMDLNHARLPIPPLRHLSDAQAGCAEQAAILSLANALCGVNFPQPNRDRGIAPRPPHPSRAYTSFASKMISVLLANSFEIGQPALASAAALSNTSFVAPGTLAVVVSEILVTAKPPSTLASVTAA